MATDDAARRAVESLFCRDLAARFPGTRWTPVRFEDDRSEGLIRDPAAGKITRRAFLVARPYRDPID